MTVETFITNFAHLADAPNGVRKLRELILQLAVQGKLVPQDPSDEPASGLLKKIEAEKKKLAKEGKIKKIKPVLDANQEKQPYELPIGWCWSKLGNLAEVTGGFAFKSTNYIDNGMRVVRISDFDERGFKSEKIVRHQFSDDLNSFRLAEGNILMAMTGGTVGKSLLVKSLPEPMVVNQRVATIKIMTGIVPEYVNGLMRTYLVQDVIQSAKNSTNDNISMGDILAFWVPLPPLAEQHRIVAKVDQLMALCNELEARKKKQQQGRTRLNNAALDALLTAREPIEFADHWQRISTNFDLLYDHPETIAKLRAAILQLAVQGKLVPQDPNDEPASVLLERVRGERKSLVALGKVDKEKNFPPVSSGELVFEMPTGWEAVRFDWLCDSRLGKMLDKNKNKGTLRPYLRNTNVQWLKFELDDLKQMRFEDSELNEFEVRFGDLLVCEGGEPGRCAIWLDLEETILFQKALHRVRPFSEVNNWFLLYRLWESAQIGELSKYFTGATIKHLTGRSLGLFPLGLPPAAEQKRIVTKVDQLMALCDELEAKLNQAQQQSGKLMEATVRQLLVA